MADAVEESFTINAVRLAAPLRQFPTETGTLGRGRFNELLGPSVLVLFLSFVRLVIKTSLVELKMIKEPRSCGLLLCRARCSRAWSSGKNSVSNAVPAHTGRSLAYVGRATVLGRPTPFKDIGIPNVNDTYKGQVLTTDGKTAQAIIKDLPLRELANEVMAAALGAALKLDIPAACIGYVTDEELVATKSPRVPGGALVFVSLDVSTPSFAHVVNGHRGGAAVLTLLKALISRGQIGRCYGFDSWAANTDRHIGNLLFDGNGRPWLI
ncbi:MAG: hypothetical protein JNK01_04260, partial [Devosia sp.]|nr:hypothetical protein [Devosia sp.]